MGIEAFVISNRISGLAFYVKSYFFLEENKKQLLSGFIHAITTISKEISNKDGDPSKLKESRTHEKLIELDFRHFFYLICDYKDLRIVFILKEKASERFKTQAKLLLETIYLQFSDEIENWNGNLEIFDSSIPQIMNKCFDLHYREHFKLNKPKFVNRIRKAIELSRMEIRVLNVINSMIIGRTNFHLKEVIELIEETNKDFVIEAIELLIEKGIIVPSGSK